MAVTYVKITNAGGGAPNFNVHNIYEGAVAAENSLTVGNLLVLAGAGLASGAEIASVVTAEGSFDVDLAPFQFSSLFVCSKIIEDVNEHMSIVLTYGVDQFYELDYHVIELTATEGFDGDRVRTTVTNFNAGASTSYPCGPTDGSPVTGDMAIASLISEFTPGNVAFDNSYSRINASNAWLEGARKALVADGATETTATGNSRSNRTGSIVVYKEISEAPAEPEFRFGVYHA